MLSRLALAFSLVSLVACERKSPDATPAPPPVIDVPKPNVKAARAVLERVEVPEVSVRTTTTSVHFAWKAPAGTAVNEDAPFKVRWSRSEGLAEVPAEVKATGAAATNGFDIAVTPLAGAPHATLDGEVDLVVCDSVNHAVCVPVKRAIDLGFVVAKDAPGTQEVAIALPAAKVVD